MSGRHKRKSGPPFVQLYRWMLNAPAWQALDPVARALYVELKKHYTGSNNGSIGLSARQAGEALSVHHATAARAFQRLIDHGFIVAIAKGIPGTGSGYHLATEWLLTEAYDDRTRSSASRDFMQWKPADDIKITVANNEDRVAPARRDGSRIPQKPPPRRTSATSKLNSEDSASHQRDTLTSSHRQVRRVAVSGGAE